MKTLLITHPLPAAPFTQALLKRLPDLRLTVYRPQLTDAELADVEVVLGWQMPPGLATRLPALRWVCSVAAGVEKLLSPDLPAATPVSRIVDLEQAAGIAQFVVARALQHIRAFDLYARQQRERAWIRHPGPVGRPVVAVLGTGAMGGEIAAWLGRVGLDVRGWSRRSTESLESLLAASDIVVCALPLTPETHGILDARTFALMRRGAFVINVARGAHIVEADLIAAVRSGQLSGAALDVQTREPLPADDPLWSTPGIVITPHIAAQASYDTIAEQFADGLDALGRGTRPPHEIDRLRGYELPPPEVRVARRAVQQRRQRRPIGGDAGDDAIGPQQHGLCAEPRKPLPGRLRIGGITPTPAASMS